MSEEVLNDIRQQIAELNRKTPRIKAWYVRLVAVLFLLFVLMAAVDSMLGAFKRTRKPPVDSWRAVETLVDCGEPDQAYAMLQRLEKKAPTIAVYHTGEILLQMGKLDLALAAYKRLYEIYPSEGCEGRIRTLTKVLEERSAPRTGLNEAATNVPPGQP